MSLELVKYMQDRDERRFKEQMARMLVADTTPRKCFHEYNSNLSGHYEMKRYGCICKKEVNHERS